MFYGPARCAQKFWVLGIDGKSEQFHAGVWNGRFSRGAAIGVFRGKIGLMVGRGGRYVQLITPAFGTKLDSVIIQLLDDPSEALTFPTNH